MTPMSAKRQKIVETSFFWGYFDSLKLVEKVVKNCGLTPFLFGELFKFKLDFVLK